jgi:hypothetical protein
MGSHRRASRTHADDRLEPLAPFIASEIEVHVAQESELHVLVSRGAGAQEAVVESLALSRQSVHVHLGDPINRKHLDRVLDEGAFDLCCCCASASGTRWTRPTHAHC